MPKNWMGHILYQKAHFNIPHQLASIILLTIYKNLQISSKMDSKKAEQQMTSENSFKI